MLLAPGLLSMVMVCFSRSCRRCVTRRATTSVNPPGVYGTMTRIGFEGHDDCPSEAGATMSAAANPRAVAMRWIRLSMAVSFLHGRAAKSDSSDRLGQIVCEDLNPRSTHMMKKRPASSKATAPDAIALLKGDHKAVSKMFEDYDKLGEKAHATKLKLARRICSELKVHTQIEEEIFYPATRAVLPKEADLLDEAEVEHASAKDLIAQLDATEPDDEFFDAKIKVLGEYIKHHVKEEHEEMFPKVRKTDLDLKELGMRMAFRKTELSKRVSP